MQVFIINGTAQSGKDTFVETVSSLIDGYYIILNISTIDIIKKILNQDLNIIYNKSKEHRTFLSNVKSEWMKLDPFGPCKYIEKRISEESSKIKETIVFIHSREKEDIERLCSFFSNAKKILIDDGEVKNLSLSDVDVKNNIEYDFIIDSSKKTYEDITKKAIYFLNEIF